MPDNATEVTAAGIARLAGVGRAAVSNWRRRYADFPRPVGGTETSPSFALADVEQWLRDQGKLAEVPLRERVWQVLSGDPAGAAAALVRAGCVLLLVRDRPLNWLDLAAAPDVDLAASLPPVIQEVLAAHFAGPGAPGSGDVAAAVHTPAAAELLASAPLVRGAAELAAELGARQTFEFLLGRYLDANPRQYTLTPPEPAALMAALADASARRLTVLDPASGTGTLLAAAAHPAALYAQETAPELAALTALRLALRTDAATTRISVAAGDTLRRDGFPQLAADVVLCHPPFNERAWGHDELAYDPRWEYGFPARTESELAWVQHAVARLRPGGTAVLLMPPAAASRRSGRRIRAELLRRGALRAVVALPAGAAPPYGVPLHLWVLRRPGPGAVPSPELLLVDTANAVDGGRGGREGFDWQAVHATALDAWRAFDRKGTADEQPGISRAVSVIDLLDDDVDLAPARHLPPAAPSGSAQLSDVHARLTEALRLVVELTPPPAGAPAEGTARRLGTTVGELARAGALTLHGGGAATGPAGPLRLLTEHDVIAGAAPSGTLPEGSGEEPVLLVSGDVVVPVLGGGSVARVVDDATAGAALGRNLHLLRPDPAALDPWFLAGFLRGTANKRQASSHASTATRLDVRRLQLPRLPLAEQRLYGAHFRALSAFEDALRRAGHLGDQLVQGLYDGLTDGTLGTWPAL